MMKTWVCDSGQQLEISIPFLGKIRPVSGRCCQTCTPQSWNAFHHPQLPALGFRDAIRVTEEDTRYRGWLVRRVCAFLAVWDWKVPPDLPSDLPARICRTKRVQDVACGSGADGGSRHGWKEKVLQLLAEIQAPLSRPLLRLCHWALLKLLARLFLNVQLHRGQLEMVRRAQRMLDAPLVFLSTHQSLLDGPLLAFILFSQGLGAPRVAVGGRPCSPLLRALLSRLGGVFLPSGMEQRPGKRDQGLPGAVLAMYIEEVLRSQQPLLIFLEEPPSSRHLSAAARQWLAPVCWAVRDGAIPDVLLVPVGIAYDVVPGGSQQEGARPPQPLGLGGCLWAAGRALRQSFGCVRVDFAQPFSLWEFATKTLARRSCEMKPPKELPLLPTILDVCPGELDGAKAEMGGPGPATAPGLEEEEEEMVVTELGLHCLSDAITCSTVTAVGITAALLLHKHPEGVFLSRLMRDFSWLLEEILLRQRDVAFSGELRALVQHSLVLLGPHLTLYRLGPLGDILVVPGASAEARSELARCSAAVLPVFAHEAVGACAIRALLLELLPFLGGTVRPSDIVLGHHELHRKTLELLRLLPPNLLGLQLCQPLAHQSQHVVDKLQLCGLLEAEEESERCVCDLAPWPLCKCQPSAGMDFSDSEEEEVGEVPKRCFKLCEPQGSPGFLLFLCRLLSPVLGTYARAAAFLGRPQWPQPEAAYVDVLLQFLAEEDGFDAPSRSLALSTLQTFKAMGVLEETQTPTGPLLQLAQPFRSPANRARLEAFIHQFTQS